MKRKKKALDKRAQRIMAIVCLSFLIAVAVGALCANIIGTPERTELAGIFQTNGDTTEDVSFLKIFWKYFKYDALIWLGGRMSMGIFISGGAFIVRSVSVGFASAMVMLTYGAKGAWRAFCMLLPQNLFLIPAYIIMTCAALYYLTHGKDTGGKRGLPRERRKRQTEYCIIFLATALLIAGGAGVEIMIRFY